MDRRSFMKTGGAVIALAGAGLKAAQAYVPAHNWDKYDFGPGPQVKNRLYQGPFPQYAPEEIVPGSDVIMATTPSNEIVPNYGMGLTVYISGDFWPPRTRGDTLEKYCEDLISLPFVQKIYIRLNWRDIQQQPGKLDFPEGWKITFDLARRYKKQVGFRIMLENPDYEYPGMPEFLMEKVPYVKLKGEWKRNSTGTRYTKEHKMPQYDHPAYQAAFREMNELLAGELNGNPQVEYMDTMMYGFWGEGHTWPYEGHPFADDYTAESTFVKMFETQLDFWNKIPLVTNTQPDFSRVGNNELLERTIRSHNWIRTDTIFIENTQIEALSNRPPWIAAICEVGMTTGELKDLGIVEGITRNENIISHVIDVGANYWSVWNWHNIAVKNILSYYEKYPQPIDHITRRIGYRVRPSFIWAYEKENYPGLVMGFANDGIAAVPGILRVNVCREDDMIISGGCLDAGYPLPGKIRQAQFVLPKGTDWKGLKVKAELEVKGMKYPLRWACHQQLNEDSSLTLRSNLRRD
jgi:hypothetical protein